MAVSAGGRGGGKQKAKKKPERKPFYGGILGGLGIQPSIDRSNSQKIQGGYAGFLMQGGSPRSPYFTASDEEMRAAGLKVAPRKGFGPGTEQPLAQGADGMARRGVSSPADQLDQFFSQLMGMVGAGGASFDYETALRESNALIRKAYEQDIKAVRSGNRQARRQTAAGRKELERLYSGLAQSYADMGDKQFREGKQMSNILERQAKRSARGLTNEAQDMLGESAALAEGLGVQQGFTETTKPLLEESLGAAQGMRKEGRRDAARQLKFGQNNRRFMGNQSVNAELEGTNRQAGLVGDLQNFLQDSARQIMQLKGARGHEIAQNRMTMQGQAAEAEAAANSAQWDQLMDLAGLKLDTEKLRMDDRQARARLEQDIREAQMRYMNQDDDGSGLPDYIKQYSDIIAGTSQPRRNMGFFDSFFNENAEGRFTAANQVDILKMNPEKAAQLAAEAARRAGVPEKDIPEIRLAAMIRAQGSF